MATRIYMGLLAALFMVAILAGSYQDIPPLLVWLLGLGLAVLIGMLALTILGHRILRGDFDPSRRGNDGEGGDTPDEALADQPCTGSDQGAESSADGSSRE